MEFVDPGGDDMVTGFADLLHRRDSQMEGITDPESACGTDMQASIAANLDLEPISRSELVDGTTSDPFGVTCKQPMYPSSDRTRRILRHGSQLEVGNAGTDPRMDLRARAMPRKMSSIKLCMLNSEGKHTPDTFAPVDSEISRTRGNCKFLCRLGSLHRKHKLLPRPVYRRGISGSSHGGVCDTSSRGITGVSLPCNVITTFQCVTTF
ncbi:hypothetical protein ACQJBY_070298 [Aegilops geniculata]